MAKQKMDDQSIRQWVLGDPALYGEAREYGLQHSERRNNPEVSGDECMYDCLCDFIEENRQRLIDYIENCRRH